MPFNDDEDPWGPDQVVVDAISLKGSYYGLAELCFDINHYNGLTYYELEYEVKKEHDHQKDFFNILKKADIEYIPSWESKYKRCLKTKK